MILEKVSTEVYVGRKKERGAKETEKEENWQKEPEEVTFFSFPLFAAGGQTVIFLLSYSLNSVPISRF